MLRQTLLQLPKEWKWFKLGDILTQKPQYGLTSKSTSEQNGIVYIRISDIREDGSLKIDNLRYVKIDKETFKKYELKENDILIARSGSVGRVYLHKDFDKPCVFASYLIRFDLNQNIILPKFFFYYSFTTFYRNFIAETFKIVAQPNINAKQFSRLLIPVPPLEEQKRIVAKLDEIFSKIEKARKLREEALKDAEQIMQSALNEVFSKAEEKGWRSKSLEEFVIEFKSGFPLAKRFRKDKGIPQLRPNNIGFYGNLDLSSLTFVPEEKVNLKEYGLKSGDVLFNNTNSKELVGRAVLIKSDLDYTFSNHITRLRINQKIVKPEWLVIALNYLWLQGYFLTRCRKWIGQAGINTKMLKHVKVPIPSLEEQERIAEYFDKLQEKIIILKKHQEETRKEIEMLTSSILNKAFTGELS
ncbi:MAG: restriction endonuclease subunit S [Candidatus Aenigmatarchaeota archaeon]